MFIHSFFSFFPSFCPLIEKEKPAGRVNYVFFNRVTQALCSGVSDQHIMNSSSLLLLLVCGYSLVVFAYLLSCFLFFSVWIYFVLLVSRNFAFCIGFLFVLKKEKFGWMRRGRRPGRGGEEYDQNIFNHKNALIIKIQ